MTDYDANSAQLDGVGKDELQSWTKPSVFVMAARQAALGTGTVVDDGVNQS